MKEEPAPDRLLVRKLKTEERTKGGIYLPPESKREPGTLTREGTVVKIGRIAQEQFPEYKPGVYVQLNPTIAMGAQLEVGEDTIWVVSPEEIVLWREPDA